LQTLNGWGLLEAVSSDDFFEHILGHDKGHDEEEREGANKDEGHEKLTPLRLISGPHYMLFPPFRQFVETTELLEWATPLAQMSYKRSPKLPDRGT
jgi:hypothetical protein